jgi:hypothetical protein
MSTSAAVAAELAAISRMGSASLREASEALVYEHMPEVRKMYSRAICDRSLQIVTDMKHWDVIAVLQGLAIDGELQDMSDSLVLFSDHIASKLSHFSPKHLIETIAVFESLKIRPKKMYIELLNRVLTLANSSMYIDELVGLMRVVAIHKLNNEDLLTGISKSILVNKSIHGQLGFLHCCELAGSLASLNFLSKSVENFLITKCVSELEVMRIEELWKSITGFKTRLNFSYKPIEDLAWSKFGELVASEHYHSLLDQVSFPMDFFQFCRMNDLVTDDVLVQTCKWANSAVYRPATRVNQFRRPTVFEVALLADLCVEREIGVDAIAKAVKITVASEGGTTSRVVKPKPLKYRRRRAYLRKADPYIERGVSVVNDVVRFPVSVKLNEAAFAPKLRSGGIPLWKSKSNAWYFRK